MGLREAGEDASGLCALRCGREEEDASASTRWRVRVFHTEAQGKGRKRVDASTRQGFAR